MLILNCLGNVGWVGDRFGFQREPVVEKIESLWKGIVNEVKKKGAKKERVDMFYQCIGRRPSKGKKKHFSASFLLYILLNVFLIPSSVSSCL